MIKVKQIKRIKFLWDYNNNGHTIIKKASVHIKHCIEKTLKFKILRGRSTQSLEKQILSKSNSSHFVVKNTFISQDVV